jgi:hypothetical protein
MGLIPDIEEDISDDTIRDVKELMEVAQLRVFKESVNEEDLNDVSENDLLDAIEFAKNRQDKTAEFVQEKSRIIQTAAGVGAVSVGGQGNPIDFSLSGIIGAFLFGYSRLFSKEIDLRKSVFEKAAYRQVTGDRWRDNWRHQRNLRLLNTKNVFQMFSTIVIYEVKPLWVRLTWESRLSRREGNNLKEWAFEIAEKYQGDREFERLRKEQDALRK